MKQPVHICLCLTAGLLICTAKLWSEEAKPKTSKEFPEAVIKFHLDGKAPGGLVERLQKHLAKVGRVKVVLGDPVANGHKPALEDTAKAFWAESDRKVFGSIVLSFAHGDQEQHGYLDRVTRIAVLNLAALKDDDTETYGRRCEKQVVRAYSAMLGVKPCLNPFCANAGYKTLEDLDRIARDACPVCLVQLPDLAKKKRIRLQPDVPLQLLPGKPVPDTPVPEFPPKPAPNAPATP